MPSFSKTPKLGSQDTALKGVGGVMLGLWSLLILVIHVWFIFADSNLPRMGAGGDLSLYLYWAQSGLRDGVWPVLDFDWVYPSAALGPIVGVALLFGTPGAYVWGWIALVSLVTIGGGGILVAKVGWRRAWLPMIWWALFLTALGPVGAMRLDGLLISLIVAALLYAASRPALSSALLAVGAWIKVAPGALIMPLVVLAKRWRVALFTAIGVAGGIGVAVRFAGAPLERVFSFVVGQADRGLQIESVLATPIVLTRALQGVPVSEYNSLLYTYEVPGGAALNIAKFSTLLMALTMAVVAYASWKARGRSAEALPVAALATMAALIVTNKVGSPQFATWLAAPVIVGLAATRNPTMRAFWPRMSILVLAVALMTQAIYPIFYFQIISGALPAVLLMVTRNIGTLSILVFSVIELVKLGTRDSSPRQVPGAGTKMPSKVRRHPQKAS